MPHRPYLQSVDLLTGITPEMAVHRLGAGGIGGVKEVVKEMQKEGKVRPLRTTTTCNCTQRRGRPASRERSFSQDENVAAAPAPAAY